MLNFLEAQIAIGTPNPILITIATETMYKVIIALTQYPDAAMRKTKNITVNANLNLPNLQPAQPTNTITEIQGIDWNIALVGMKK